MDLLSLLTFLTISTHALTSNTTYSTLCSSRNETYSCSKNGRYAVPGDTTCSKYYYCYKRSNGSFSQTLYSCTIGIFNNNTQSCDTTYDCPCSTSTTDIRTTSTLLTTTQYTTTSSSSICGVSNSNNSFGCSANGRYAVPGDTTCKQYYYCYERSNGSFSQTLYTCGAGLFNSDTQSCDTTYECPCSTSPTDITTTSTLFTTAQDTTTSDSLICDANNSNHSFICSANGRYAVPGDTTCKQYYYCYKRSNGSFTQTLYTCGAGLFNSDTQSCDTTYECPCSTSTTDITTTSTLLTTTQDTTTSASSICDASNSNNSFSCSTNGRYAVPGDTTCKQYYYCYERSNGSFTQTLYTCGAGLFNSDTQSCDTTYECPCSTSTTDIKTTSTLLTTTQDTTTSASSICDASNSNNSFSCSTNGRYAVPGDTTCKQYYYCYEGSNGSFTQTLYTCGAGLFNSDTQSCDTTYECPCSTSTTDITTTSTLLTTTQDKTTSDSLICDANNSNNSFSCSANGRYAVPGDATCKQYYYCYKRSNGSFSQTLYTCGAGLFNSDTQSCDTNYECTCSTSTTDITTTPALFTTTQDTTTSDSLICDANNSNHSFSCSANGRYAVPGDTTCKQYYYCYKRSNGSFSQTLYTCSAGSFNSDTHSCDTNYECHCSTSTADITTTSTSLTTTQDTTISASSICDASNSNNSFSCPTNGRYAVPGDTTCKQYYYCYERSNGSFSQTLYTCGAGLFNSDTQSCDTTYECPCSTSTTDIKTTSTLLTTTRETATSASSICDASNSNNSFSCSTNGRYAVPGDTTCKQYYYCYKRSNGSFTQTLYTCSAGLFNSDTQSCDTTHECPCSTSTTDKMTTPTLLTTTRETATSASSICDANNSFSCSTNGRYAVPGDTTCKQYYYCYKRSNGSFSQTLYTCGAGLFNSDAQSCDTTYECPCSTSTTDIMTTSTSSDCTVSSFTCSTTGKFSDPADLTCKKYYVCRKLFFWIMSSHTSCSNGYFNPITKICDVTYKCPCSEDNTSTTASDSSESNSTSCLSSSISFTCTEQGRFADPSDSTCSKYYTCLQLIPGKFMQINRSCRNSLFNPNSRKCDNSYNCTCST